MSAPCTFFRIWYKHSEYEVFQAATLREGLIKILNNEDRLHLQARALMSDDELLDYMFRLGAQELRHAGWGLERERVYNASGRCCDRYYNSRNAL